MKDLVQKGIAKVSDFGVVTPYLEQLKLYIDVKQTIPFFKDLKVTTANKIQGFDELFVFVDLVLGSNMAGLGAFVTKKRLAVMLTRQREGLVVVMDSGCLATPKKERRMGNAK
jgi:superfamily I DNA and/or RNA helicase